MFKKKIGGVERSYVEYRVTFTINGRVRKHLYKTLVREKAYEMFNKIVRDNTNSVILEKKHSSDVKVNKVTYGIYLVKDYVEGDHRRKSRDSFGVAIDEPLLSDRYTIIDDAPFKIEEKFWVYGYDSINDRKTVIDIMNIVYDKDEDDRFKHKFALILRNKLVIWNEEKFHMVICKNQDDASRLQQKMKELSIIKKLTSITYGGTCAKNNTSKIYKLIMENTGWNYTKVKRSTTRP